jgi:PAS domain S-box-containing protein
MVEKGSRPTSADIARINRQLETRVRELSTLYSIGRVVTSSLDLEQVLGRIVEAAVFLTSAEESFLLLIDEASGDLYMRAGKGLGQKVARGFRVKVDDSIAGEVVHTGKPINIGGADQPDTYKIKTGYLVKSLLSVPLKLREQVIGVLSVDNMVATGRPFTDHDLSLLSALADYAAVAIENARLYQQAEERAQELAQALESKAEQPTPEKVAAPGEQELEALQQFIRGLHAQRDELERDRKQAEEMAKGLRTQAEEAEQLAQRLALWGEEVEHLVPELRWLGTLEGAGTALQAPGERSAKPTLELLDQLTEGILISDTRRQIVAANSAASRILGVDQDTLVGQELQMLWDDPRWARLLNSLWLALALSTADRPPPPSPEATLWPGERPVRAKLVPMLSDGKATGVTVILRDMSAETEGWRARDKSLLEISQALRSPMSTIAGYTELLLSESVGLIGNIQRRYLLSIRDGVARMDAFLRGLGEEKVATPPHPVTPRPVSTIVDEAVEIVREVLQKKGIGLHVEAAPGLPSVRADPESICQIVVDLLVSASSEMPAGTTMELRARMQKGDAQPRHLILSVRGRFGAGKGEQTLRVARELAEAEGGRTWIDEEPTGERTVSLLLPTVGDEET